MAICEECQGEMLEGSTCLPDPIMISGRPYEPIRWGEERTRGTGTRPKFSWTARWRSVVCTTPGA